MDNQIKHIYINIMNNIYYGVWFVVFSIIMSVNIDIYTKAVATKDMYGVFILVLNVIILGYNAFKMKSPKEK